MRDPHEHYCNANNNNQTRSFFVATTGSESGPNDEVVVGTIAVQEASAGSVFNPATDAEIRRVSVVPAARGQGVARELYKQVEMFVKNHKRFKRIVLSTTSLHAKALMMYKHYGFREMSRQPILLGGSIYLVNLTKDIIQE